MSTSYEKKRFVETSIKKKYFELKEWERKAIAIILVIFAGIIQLLGLWAIDISVAAMIVKIQLGQEIMLTNGFYIRDPMQMYHIGLYTVIVSSFVIMALFVFQVIKKKET